MKVNLVLKRLLDIFISISIFILLFPFLIIVAVLIKLDSKGPVFFSQQRIGKNGKYFNIYKFRTMIPNAETIGTGLFSYENDPRITRLGNILRVSSIDELPQLINVINGTMSLVGPRAPVTYELGNYSDFSDDLKSRFVVKPGVTGLAQVSGRNDLGWPEKIKYDLKYIEKFRKYGVMYDLLVLFKTIPVVFKMGSTIEKEKEEN
jgi:lipopolysaccharide/colanic/teichoic acid biosynthesis glycosyltransferase